MSAAHFAMVGMLGLGAAASGCSEGDTDDFPTSPGGDTPGTIEPGAPPDATLDASGGDASGDLVGRVCLIGDLRAVFDPAACAATGAGDLLVTLGDATARTSESGAFSIARAAAADALVLVSGAGVTRTAMPLTAGTTIPVIRAAAYTAIADGSFGGDARVPGEGSFVVRLRRAGAPVVGALVASDSQVMETSYYDTAVVTAWEADATGPRGLAWQPRATPGVTQTSLTITDPSSETPSPVVPLVPDALTVMTIDLP